MALEALEPEHREFFEERLAQEIDVIAAGRADQGAVIVGRRGLTIIWRGLNPAPGRGLFSVFTPWWMITEIAPGGQVFIRGEDNVRRELAYRLPDDVLDVASVEWRNRVRSYRTRRNLLSQAFLQDSLPRLQDAIKNFIRERGLRHEDVAALSHAASSVPALDPGNGGDAREGTVRIQYSALLLYRDPDEDFASSTNGSNDHEDGPALGATPSQTE